MNRLLEAFLRFSAIFNPPAGMVPDAFAAYGLFGLMQNVNNYAESLSSISTFGTSVTLIAASAVASGNAVQGFVQLNAGASGALTVNFPTTAAIMAALGNSVAFDGSYSESLHIVNNSGQTATLTAGDAGQTFLGSATLVTGTVRKLMLRVLNSSTLTFTNVGTWTL